MGADVDDGNDPSRLVEAVDDDDYSGDEDYSVDGEEVTETVTAAGTDNFLQLLIHH